MNAAFYKTVLSYLRESIRRKRPTKWKNEERMGSSSRQCAEPQCYTPSFFSPNLASSDFWLFLRHKRPLKGERFNTIKENVKTALPNIPKEKFAKCFSKWISRWKKCIDKGGDYFEGDRNVPLYVLHRLIKLIL